MIVRLYLCQTLIQRFRTMFATGSHWLIAEQSIVLFKPFLLGIQVIQRFIFRKHDLFKFLKVDIKHLVVDSYSRQIYIAYVNLLLIFLEYCH